MDLIELDAQIPSISHYLIYDVSQKGVALWQKNPPETEHKHLICFAI